MKFESTMIFNFGNAKKIFIVIEEGDEIFKSENIFCFCEKSLFSINDRDQCHLTGKNRGSAH